MLKRLVLLIVKLPTLAQPLAAKSPTFIKIAQMNEVLVLVLALAVVCVPACWHVELPIVFIPFWNVFGIELLTHLVHTHSAYHLFGLIQLALLAPALAVVVFRLAQRWRPPVMLRRRPVAIAGAAGLVLFSAWAYTAVRRELVTFDIWYGPWVGMYRTPLDADALEPARVGEKIERLRTLGERTPGSISMYAVWMLFRLSTNVWTAEAGVGDRLHLTRDEVEGRRQQARTLAAAYFRRAATEAPDNPWIQTFADLWDVDHLVPAYARQLDRHPDHPFALWWAHMLARRTDGETSARYYARLDELTHRYFERTASLRPQFVQAPAGDDPALTTQRDGSTEVKFDGGATASLGSTDAFRSDRLGLLVNVRAISGTARASLIVKTDQGIEESPEQLIGASDVDTYRMFRWNGSAPANHMSLRLRSAGGAAVVRVRDYYPMIENPHVASLE